MHLSKVFNISSVETFHKRIDSEMI